MEYQVSTSYEFQNCRDGFNHIATLWINDIYAAKTKVHYINRTWEAYNGQTAMKNVCKGWMDITRDEMKEALKVKLGVKRATKKVLEQLEVEIANNEKYQVVKRHYESL